MPHRSAEESLYGTRGVSLHGGSAAAAPASSARSLEVENRALRSLLRKVKAGATAQKERQAAARGVGDGSGEGGDAATRHLREALEHERALRVASERGAATARHLTPAVSKLRQRVAELEGLLAARYEGGFDGGGAELAPLRKLLAESQARCVQLQVDIERTSDALSELRARVAREHSEPRGPGKGTQMASASAHCTIYVTDRTGLASIWLRVTLAGSARATLRSPLPPGAVRFHFTVPTDAVAFEWMEGGSSAGAGGSAGHGEEIAPRAEGSAAGALQRGGGADRATPASLWGECLPWRSIGAAVEVENGMEITLTKSETVCAYL